MTPHPLVPSSRLDRILHILQCTFPLLPPVIVLPILLIASFGTVLFWDNGLTSALLAFPLLLCAQCLRAGRLALLLRYHGLGLRLAAEVHAAGAAVSLLVPLKIGEIWRWFAVARTGAGLGPAFLALWAERLLDAVLLVPLLAGALIFGLGAPPLLVAVLSLFLFLSLILLGVGPREAPALARAIMARHKGPKATRAMAFLFATAHLLAKSQAQIQGQSIPLLLLTLLLWTAEATAVGILLGIDPVRLLLAPLAVAGGALSDELDPVLRLQASLGPAAASYLLAATLAAFSLWSLGRLLRDRQP